jgi:hypothetical protein
VQTEELKMPESEAYREIVYDSISGIGNLI